MALTADQIEEVKRRRASKKPEPWEMIARDMGVPAFKLRCAIEPNFREYRLGAVKRYRARVRHQKSSTRSYPCAENNYRISQPSFNVVTPDERINIPRHVLADREVRLGYVPATITAAICGDPEPWRSALATRQAR